MSSVTIDNLKVSYREWGNSDTVILMLHGWPADSSHYAQLGPDLAKRGFRVIVPDFPGFGATPEPPQAWSVSDYRDLIKQFTKQLELKSFVLFGHSFGGRVAIKYAINYPYELQALVLCASAGIKPDPTTVKRKILKLSASVGKKAFALPLINKLAPTARKALYKLAGSSDYNKVDGVMKETIVKVIEEDLSPLLGQISMQTLLLWGSEDGATPISEGKKMHGLIAHSQLKVLEGQRHNLPKNVPAKVAEAIGDFLKKGNKQVIE